MKDDVAFKPDLSNQSLTFETYSNSCQYRLPCGICERTNKQCPLLSWGPTWSMKDIYYTSTSTNPEHDTVNINDNKFDYTMDCLKEKPHD